MIPLPNPFFEEIKKSEIGEILEEYLPRELTDDSVSFKDEEGYTRFINRDHTSFPLLSQNLDAIQRRQDLLREFYRSPKLLREVIRLGQDLGEIVKNLSPARYVVQDYQTDKVSDGLFDNPQRKKIRSEFKDRIQQGIRDFESEDHAFITDLTKYLKHIVDPKNGCESKWRLDDQMLEELVSPQVLVVEYDHQSGLIRSIESLGGFQNPEVKEKLTGLLNLPPQGIIAERLRKKIKDFSLYNGMDRIAGDMTDLNERLAWYQSNLNFEHTLSQRGLRSTIPEVHAGKEINYQGIYPFWEKNPVANNLSLTEDKYGLLLTGSNAGGKTSLMLQVGVAQILAQSGGFVPATSGRVGIVSQVIYATPPEQNLNQEGSLFEQNVASLRKRVLGLKPRDLFLADEVIQGTSEDGLSKTLETLVDTIGKTSQVRFMIATHHHDQFDDTQYPYVNCIRPSRRRYTFEEGRGRSEGERILRKEKFTVSDLVRDYPQPRDL